MEHLTPLAIVADLAARGVILSLQGDSIEIEAPAGTVAAADVERLREHKPEIVAALRGQAAAEESASSLRCCWCGSKQLVDTGISICCDSCSRRVWIDTPDGGLVRADFADDWPEDVDPDSVSVCPSCRRYCDTETGAGEWRCSRCDQTAAKRRQTVQRWLTRKPMPRSRATRSARR